MKPEIPIWEKSNLTIEEAAVYFNIGASTLRRLAAREDCPYVLWVGSKCLIKRVCFEEYLQKAFSI
ncbi:MAG: helix-turn-helix domain-containing protein [Clostridia bacterium]|nr:helix-turn-helix domain-containing protein [Clostridia bacterium]